MPIMSSAEWIRDTKRYFHSRGTDLTNLDTALVNYHSRGRSRARQS